MRTINIYVLMLSLLQAALGGIAENFTQIGSVMQTSADPLTGRGITSFTNSTNIAMPQPDRNVWVQSDGFVVFETDMPRPSGSSSGAGEKQLAAVNVATGNFYWIAPLEVENPFIYGAGHFNMPADAHFACSRQNDLVAYRDVTGHRLYLKRLSDNTTIELLRLFAGTFIGEPAISDAGSVVIIEAIHKGPDTDYYDGTNHCIIRFNIDVANMLVLGDAEVIESFANRKANASQPAEKLGKPVLSPDGSWIAFRNRQTSLDGQITYGLRYCRGDGTVLGKFVDKIGEVGGMWCSGSDLYFVAEGGFSRANLNSTGYQQWRKVSTGNAVKVKNRVKTSNDKVIPLPRYMVGMDNLMRIEGNVLVYNTLPNSYDGNGLGSTVIYSLNTASAEKSALASARQGSQSSKKINFHVSGDGKRIIYTDFGTSGSKVSVFAIE